MKKIKVTKTVIYVITPDCPDYPQETLDRVEELIQVDHRPYGLYEDWEYELVSETAKTAFIDE